MTTYITTNPNEPALNYFSQEECKSIPEELWTADPTDHRARNWLLEQYPKVISRSLQEIKDPDFKAEDGSQFRLLTYGKQGQIAHSIFPQQMTANAVIHSRVTEQWYCCRGEGILWLKNAETSEIKKISFAASSCLTIPPRTAFRFINTGKEPLECVLSTTPLWETLRDGESAEHLLPKDSPEMAQVPTTEAPRIIQKNPSFQRGEELCLLQATEPTELVQMGVWTIPPRTTTKIFRSMSETESYYILSGTGNLTYSLGEQSALEKMKLETGCAISCPSSATRQIQTEDKPLTILVVSQPKI